MDWAKQSREMSEAWLEGQRAAWEQWTRAMSGTGAPGGANWERMIAAWREAVDGALEMQAGWIERWAAMGEDVEDQESARKWAAQGQEMMSGWMEAQHGLWGAFFDAAASMGPSRPPNPMAEATHAWQDAVTRMVDMQGEWARAWGSGVPGAEQKDEESTHE